MIQGNISTNFQPSDADHLAQSQPAPLAGSRGLVSILVTCCGQLEYTKLCVMSLLRHTAGSFELLFLDVGSVDGTAEYLAGVAAATTISVEVVRTVTDLGIAAACGQALGRAHGEFLVLLNNDTLVTSGWLNQLVELANLSPTIGMVGPMSNHATPPQLVETVPYRIRPKTGMRPSGYELPADEAVDVSPVDRFAEEWRSQRAGKWCEAEQLGGFCLLIKCELLKKLGIPKNGSELEIFDATSMSHKTRRSGYRLACSLDLFIHNFGSRNFWHRTPN
jgi:GT2 family glycosyltransferase